MKKTLVFITTHIVNEAVISEYKKLMKVGSCDCILVIDNTNLEIGKNETVSEIEFWGISVKCFFFNKNMHGELNLPYFAGNDTNADFPKVMWYNSECRFYYVRKYFPEYEYYWQLEYDVFCNGDSYQPFLDKFENNNNDLIIQEYAQTQLNGEWPWSHNIEWAYGNTTIYRSILPICRLSGKAIDFIYQRKLQMAQKYLEVENKQKSFWPFCEVFVPTELTNNGFSATALCEEHVTWDMEYDLTTNRIYERPDYKLYHPVKGMFIKRENSLKEQVHVLNMNINRLIQNNETLNQRLNNELNNTNYLKQKLQELEISNQKLNNELMQNKDEIKKLENTIEQLSASNKGN